MLSKQILLFYNDNKIMTKRYLNFIDKRINREFIKTEYYEHHHIIPVSFGGSNSKYNKVKLTGREHYIVHWMLAKILKGKMWYAFNIMGRTLEKRKSVLYELRQKYLSEEMSKTQTGRICSIETRQKMSKNGIKGKYCYNNGEIDIFCDSKEFIPEKFIKGSITKGKKKHLIGTTFYHNPITLEQKRLLPLEEIPKGWIKGRKPFDNKAFEYINSKTKIYNILENKIELVDNEKYLNNKLLFKFGIKINQIKIFCYNNLMFESGNTFVKFGRLNNIYADRNMNINEIIKSTRLSLKTRKNIIGKEGLTYKELGYNMFTITELYKIDLTKYKIIRKHDVE